jgi:hypothetical protein
LASSTPTRPPCTTAAAEKGPRSAAGLPAADLGEGAPLGRARASRFPGATADAPPPKPSTKRASSAVSARAARAMRPEPLHPGELDAAPLRAPRRCGRSSGRRRCVATTISSSVRMSNTATSRAAVGRRPPLRAELGVARTRPTFSPKFRPVASGR